MAARTTQAQAKPVVDLRQQVIAWLMGPHHKGSMMRSSLPDILVIRLPGRPPHYPNPCTYYVSSTGGIRYCCGDAPSITRSISTGTRAWLRRQTTRSPEGTPPLTYVFECGCRLKYMPLNGHCPLHGGPFVTTDKET